jgi:hypothetical protein
MELNFTVGIPVRNRVKFANEAIKSVIENSKYPIIVIDDNSDRPDGEYIKNDRVKVIYNTEKKGLTSLWNQILNESETEYIILMGDKLRPLEKDFTLIEEKLKMGFGIVATYMLGFFGMSKFLINKIGIFDEGFTSGGFEDTDIMNRLFINDIALYFSMETEYIKIPTNWSPNTANQTYYNTKWFEDWENKLLIQLKSDFDLIKKGNIKKYKKINYLTWDKSELLSEHIESFYKIIKPIKKYED